MRLEKAIFIVKFNQGKPASIHPARWKAMTSYIKREILK